MTEIMTANTLAMPSTPKLTANPRVKLYTSTELCGMSSAAAHTQADVTHATASHQILRFISFSIGLISIASPPAIGSAIGISRNKGLKIYLLLLS